MAKVGNYRLLGQLGQGGMADVFLGVMESGAAPATARFTKLVVVKRLRFARDDEQISMFFDEARLAARLNHPNVVQTNEVGESDGSYFMVMEYLEGQSFDRLLRLVQKGTIPRSEANVELWLYVLAEALSGLHHAHDLRDFDGTSLGIVHRDVSPHNVFVTYEGQVKVLDFGVAKAERRTHRTTSGLIKGKIRYMAPEQAMAAPLDRRADLFAAGVLLYEAFGGQRFWSQDQDEAAVLRGLFEGKFPTRCEGAPPAVQAILAKALTREAESRYATADLFRKDILAYLRSCGADLDTLRERLAALMQHVFADDRMQVAKVIETELAASVIAGETAAARVVPEDGPSVIGLRGLSQLPAPALQALLSPPVAPRVQRLGATTMPMASQDPTAITQTVSSDDALSPDATFESSRRRRMTAWVAAVALLGAAVIGIAAWAGGRQEESLPSALPPPAAAESSVAPVAATPSLPPTPAVPVEPSAAAKKKPPPAAGKPRTRPGKAIDTEYPGQ